MCIWPRSSVQLSVQSNTLPMKAGLSAHQSHRCSDEYEVAVDYVGAGVGDTVIAGGAPGVAKSVFNLDKAPIKTLIMGIVD